MSVDYILFGNAQEDELTIHTEETGAVIDLLDTCSKRNRGYALRMLKLFLAACDSQKPRRKQRGIKFETPQGAGYLTLAAVAKCLQAATWLVARGNKSVDSEQ